MNPDTASPLAWMLDVVENGRAVRTGQRPADSLGIEAVGETRLKIRLNQPDLDRKSTRLNSSHVAISYAVFCLKKKNAQLYGDAIDQPSRGTLVQGGQGQEPPRAR